MERAEAKLSDLSYIRVNRGDSVHMERAEAKHTTRTVRGQGGSDSVHMERAEAKSYLVRIALIEQRFSPHGTCRGKDNMRSRSTFRF